MYLLRHLSIYLFPITFFIFITGTKQVCVYAVPSIRSSVHPKKPAKLEREDDRRIRLHSAVRTLSTGANSPGTMITADRTRAVYSTRGGHWERIISHHRRSPVTRSGVLVVVVVLIVVTGGPRVVEYGVGVGNIYIYI